MSRLTKQVGYTVEFASYTVPTWSQRNKN